MKNKALFEAVCRASEATLKAVLTTYLRSNYKQVISHNDYVCAIGDIPILLVAHLDTVFATPPKDIYYDQEQQVVWSPQGGVGDDRSGVYLAMQILQAGYRPHVAFTCGEEVGGIGASALAELNCPFKDLRYMIELDRQGRNDMVFYDCDNKEFINYIGSFGFEFAHGSFTDITFLMDAWSCAGVNLSCGYLGQHSATEILHVDWMEETCEKVCKMLDCANEAPHFEFIPYANYWNWTHSVDHNSCYFCGKALAPEERVPVLLEDGTAENFCIDCAASIEVEWCENCGNPFIPAHEIEKICPKCSIEKEIVFDGN